MKPHLQLSDCYVVEMEGRHINSDYDLSSTLLDQGPLPFMSTKSKN